MNVIDVETSREDDAASVFRNRLEAFERAIAAFRERLSGCPGLAARVFEGAGDWEDLLRDKLLPELAGPPCIVAAIAGGTNTGKTTIFNVLAGGDFSPVRHTAAATCHPVLAASPARAQDALSGRLLPRFAARPMEDPAQALDRGLPADTLFVVEAPGLHDGLALLDTPDVDSIDTGNWENADRMRAAGDVVIAVLTAEKYKDARVVAFFRKAREAGRLVFPLMNKADSAEADSTAARQLADFAADAALPPDERFVLLHDRHTVSGGAARPMPEVNGGADLRARLDSLDPGPVKARALDASVRLFLEETAAFLAHAGETGRDAVHFLDEIAGLSAAAAKKYRPAPGKEVSGLFHAFMQEKRGRVTRALGGAARGAVDAAGWAGRKTWGALRRAGTLESGEGETRAERRLREMHERQVTQIARELAGEMLQAANDRDDDLSALVRDRLKTKHTDAAVARVVAAALVPDDLSEDFKRHARAQLDAWWTEHPGTRKALRALDGMLASAPLLIAAPMAMATQGLGVPEFLGVSGTLGQQFMKFLFEYKFGDRWRNLMAPWVQEQQERLAGALDACLVAPALEEALRAASGLRPEALAELEAARSACLSAWRRAIPEAEVEVKVEGADYDG